MTKVAYPGSSPYANTYQTSWHIGLYEDRVIAKASDDEQVTIDTDYHLRPDLMAYRIYGDSEYWWVFMARNPNVIRDPIYDHVAGAVIWVPSASHLRKI